MIKITPEDVVNKLREDLDPMTDEERYEYLTELGFTIIGRVPEEERVEWNPEMVLRK